MFLRVFDDLDVFMWVDFLICFFGNLEMWVFYVFEDGVGFVGCLGVLGMGVNIYFVIYVYLNVDRTKFKNFTEIVVIYWIVNF